MNRLYKIVGILKGLCSKVRNNEYTLQSCNNNETIMLDNKDIIDFARLQYLYMNLAYLT